MQKQLIDILLIVGFLLLVYLFFAIKKQKNQKRIHKYFMAMVILLQVHIIAMLLQSVFSEILTIPLIYYEYLTGCGAEFIPIIFLMTALIFQNPEFNTKKVKLVLIIPIFCLISLWTNDLHHLFYRVYDINFSNTEYGIVFYIHTIYSYLSLGLGVIVFVTSSLKKSGIFSKETMLISFGCAIPLVFNILATLKIISLSVYVTPLLYSCTAICLWLSIIKYKALNITPIAFRTIIDTMSDAYIVISDDGTVVDNNMTFHKLFKDVLDSNQNDDFFQMLDEKNLIDTKELKKKIAETRKTGNIVTENYHLTVENKIFKSEEDRYFFDKYFEVDIHPIKASRGKEYVGTLLLFKDITQHIKDMQELEAKQDVIVKQGQLVSIGELAGGVAHDINTPISAIKTGVTMLKGFYTPRDDKEKELLDRMDNCADKIIKIVNSMRNQIRNLGSSEKVKFKISDVLKDIQVITYNEITKHKCSLEVNIQDDVYVMGEPTKLGQVFTNLIVNAVQAYPEDKGGKIEVEVSKAPDNKCMIKIRDYAGGIPEEIKQNVFKSILTTKGTQGTGLGLYLAYSVIKGEFSGDITFESESGEGTTFYIVLDRIKND